MAMPGRRLVRGRFPISFITARQLGWGAVVFVHIRCLSLGGFGPLPVMLEGWAEAAA